MNTELTQLMMKLRHVLHLMKQEDSRVLSAVADTLLRLPTVYYTVHCTGQTQYDFLKARMDNRLHRLSTGTVLRI